MYIFLLILIAVLPIPLYLGFKNVFKNRHHRRSAFALKVALDRVIKRNSLSISEMDTFNNRVIALDRKNNKLMLAEHRNNVTWEKCLLLEEPGSYAIHKEVDPSNGSIQKIVMKFNFNNDIVHFPFYDAASDSILELPTRVRKATWWKNKIQQHLNNTRVSHPLEYVL